MGFSNDYANAALNTYDNKPEGDYEVIVTEIKEKTFKTGTTGLNIKMIIRNDVDQPAKNGFLFHTFWKRKNPTDRDEQVKSYSFNQIMRLASAADLPSGKNYESLEQLCDDIVDKPVVACMRLQGEYNGKPNERIVDFDKTEHPDVRHKEKPKSDGFADKSSGGFAVPSGAMIDDDDDLPFV